jgi:hypothetical protein
MYFPKLVPRYVINLTKQLAFSDVLAGQAYCCVDDIEPAEIMFAGKVEDAYVDNQSNEQFCI